MSDMFLAVFHGKQGNLAHHKKENPEIPHPQHKEVADTELLIAPDPKSIKDLRPEIIKPFANVKKPQMNRFYGSLRVEDGWKDIVDNYANGGITTVAGAQVSASVKLAANLPEIRLSRWPGAVSMYLAIRSVAVAPSTATFATLGSIDLYYQDTIGGQVIPLGSIVNSGVFSMPGMAIIVPTPITDPGISVVGNLLATLSAGATVGTYIWQMAFSYAYFLPTEKPFEVQHIEDLMDAHPGHVKRIIP